MLPLVVIYQYEDLGWATAEVDEAASLFTCKVTVVLAPVSTPITIIDVAREALLPNNVVPDNAVPVTMQDHKKMPTINEDSEDLDDEIPF